MKKFTACLLVLLICVSGIPAPVSADVADDKTYSAHSDVVYDATTGEVSVTTKVTLSSSTGEAKTNWELNWFIPSNAEIGLISAENGSVHFTKDYGRIHIERDSGEATTSETFTIKYTYQKTGSSPVQVVEKVGFSFVEQKPKWSSNSVDFTVKNGSLVEVYTASTVEQKNNSTIVMQSERGVSFTVYTSPAPNEPVVETEDYAVYGKTNLSDSEIKSAYQTAEAVTGMEPETKIPVVFTNFTNNSLDSEFAGEYKQGIVFVNSKYNAVTEYTTLAHEFQHAYNSRLIGHTPVWFNEGLAELTESRANHEAGVEPSTVKYTNTIDQIDSKSEIPVFDEFESKSRSFGYYYTGLMFKSFVQSNGLNAHQSAYASLVNSTEGQFLVENKDIEKSGFPMAPVCTDGNTTKCVESTMEFVPAESANISGSAPTVTTTTDSGTSATEQTTTTPTTPNDKSEGMSLGFITQISLVVAGLLVIVALGILQ